jgi:hypothetical protein
MITALRYRGVLLLLIALFVNSTTFFCSTLLFSSPLKADVIKMPDVEQTPNSDQGQERPVRGLTMDEVKEQFGEPRSVDGPVGNPPITRWNYEKFTVVFENNYVIDSFVAKSTQQQSQ